MGLDIYQQTFCLSLKICSAAQSTGSASDLEGILQQSLQDFITSPTFAGTDSWEIVWGPVVWQAPASNRSDQALAVCYNSTQNIYFVPIAATNPNSAFDVFYEDLAAVPAYMQELGSSGAKTTAGNSAGLAILGSMQSGGANLAAFLTSVANENATLIFSGHSLGGGLTPLLAWWTYSSGSASTPWKNIYTFPTAGPTTGDAAFASLFNSNYPVVTNGSGYQMWNANQYNTHDVVPNAWAPGSTPGLAAITADVQTIIGDPMFWTSPTMEAEVATLRTIAEELAGGSSNPYAPVNNNPLFTGPRNNSGWIDSNAELAAEILFQHTTAYLNEFGVSGLFEPGEVEANIQPLLLPLVLALKAPAPAEPALA